MSLKKDIYLPNHNLDPGAEHPINLMRNSIIDFLVSMGFEDKSGPEIESEKFNFDINRVLSNIPKKHYFIFIKDKLRCAKTIDTTHVGVLYERKVKKPKFSTMIQGLAGRATGIQKSYPSAIYFTLIPEKSYPKNFLDFINDTK